MDKFILIKQSFYHEYDIIRFDVIAISRSIELIKELDVNSVDKIIKILDKLYYSLFHENVKEIILIMNGLLVGDTNYSISKLLSGLEVIQTSILKKEKLYKKYVGYIDNLQEYL